MTDRLVPKWSACALGAVLSLWFITPLSQAAEKAPPGQHTPVERGVTERVDRALLQAHDPASPLPPVADDEAFLRRVCLDLTGKLPSPKEIEAFVADPDPHKRAKQIDRLLESDNYAVNWARYWRDTLTYNTPASGNY